jgi:hypothetical protein
MIKHIVFWKLKENALGMSKAENAKLMKEKLEALRGRIPELHSLEVGFDLSQTDGSADVVLYSEFATRQDLNAYQVHPEHKAIASFVMEVVKERRMADYEV